MSNIDLEGFSQLKETLVNLSNIEIQQALTQSALLVENAAKVNCPVDTGRLRASITHDIQANYADIGTNVEYAPYLEFGTGLFAVAGDGRKDRWSYQSVDGEWHSTLGQKPQPFLGPALTNNKQRIIDTFSQKMKEALDD